MKRILSFAVFFMFIILFSGKAAFADEPNSVFDISLPDEVNEALEGSGISPGADNLQMFSIENIIGSIKDCVADILNKPLTLLLTLTVIILLVSLITSIESTFSDGIKSICSFVSVLICCTALMTALSDTISQASETIRAGNVFISSFIPAFAGMISMSGYVTSAAITNGIIMTAAQLYTGFAVNVVIPFSYCALGISLAGSVIPDLKLDKISEAAKKAVIWLLGLSVTIFAFLLTVQSFISASNESVGLKTIKFTVSNSVPFIGNTIADSLAVMQGGLRVIKNDLGIFGIAAGVFLFARPLISVILYKLALNISITLSEMFSVPTVSGVLRSAEGVLSVIFALMTGFALISVISVSLMLFMFSGG